MNEDKDYEGQAAIRSIEKRLDRQETLTEASKDLMKKFAKEMFRDKQTRNSIAKECIDGIQGRVQTNNTLKTLRKDGERIPAALLDEDLPTGFEKLPWQEDED